MYVSVVLAVFFFCESSANSTTHNLVAISSSTSRFKFSLNKQIKCWSRARQIHEFACECARVSVCDERARARTQFPQNDTSQAKAERHQQQRVTGAKRLVEKCIKNENKVIHCAAVILRRNSRAYLLCKYTFFFFFAFVGAHASTHHNKWTRCSNCIAPALLSRHRHAHSIHSFGNFIICRTKFAVHRAMGTLLTPYTYWIDGWFACSWQRGTIISRKIHRPAVNPKAWIDIKLSELTYLLLYSSNIFPWIETEIGRVSAL